MTDPSSILIISMAFVFGGFVKGAAGLGMPVITVAILAFVFNLPSAMALMLIPGLATNAIQAVAGPDWRGMLKRIAPFLIPSLFTIWFGTGLLVTIDNSILIIMLGVILLIYAVIGLAGFTMQIPPVRELWIGPVFGAVNGVFTGLTGVTSTPSVIYLNGLGLAREHMVQAMGLLFLISYIVLTACLFIRGLVTPTVGAMSAFAMLPALVGLGIGTFMRKRMSEKRFKKVFYVVLIGLGLYLITRGFTG
ncbi:sulfite exporter TauE/SafE family protein [Pseudahrensia aquimaris]|uniref:Probable membrane transporter protein n=1 Tax=Pseudahrensia aquimaris TaxID=744461 RepID=A0ABW3FG73_9HYPH